MMLGSFHPSSVVQVHLRLAQVKSDRLNNSFHPTESDRPQDSENSALTRPIPAWSSCHPTTLPRKEVIQPQLPLRLPCYDFVPVTRPTLDACLLPKKVSPAASGVAGSHDVTGGVYKTREQIHRRVLTGGY